MAEAPNVTFHALSDQPAKVFVHLGEKVRAFVEPKAERVRTTLVNVLIAEFGLGQPHAEQVADEAITTHEATGSAADHVGLLQDQLADTDKQLTDMLAAKLKAESDLALAQSDLADRDRTIAQLKEQIAALTPPPPDTGASNGGETSTDASAAVGTKPGGDSPPAQQTDATPPSRGSVSTPEGETPPAETSPPQTDTGAAPNQAATGGEQGATNG